MNYKRISNKVVKRSKKRSIGIFIDGTGLDRASKRLGRKVDLSALVKTLSTGIEPSLARYYSLIPFEDDSRHRAFLTAVEEAGLESVVRRLPPKGITRQVFVDVEMATDMVSFACKEKSSSDPEKPTVPSVIAVCPERALCYPMELLKAQGIEVVYADFGRTQTHSELVKSSTQLLDLGELGDAIWHG